MTMELRDCTAADALRNVFGCFPSGVTAVCALIDGEPVGMAASSFTSVSLDPPLVSVCMQNGSATWPKLRAAPRLGLSVLSQEHSMVCRSLSRKVGDRFTGFSRLELDNGAILVRDASAWWDCELHAEMTAGDHTIVLLKICALGSDPSRPPLVFHRSEFHRLAALPPGQERR